eukprot:COSAG05_NODE_6205_length_1000_cov_1.571587_1_plen_127_part_00
MRFRRPTAPVMGRGRAKSPSHSPAPRRKAVAASTGSHLRLPFCFTGAIIALTIAGKAGDALAPSLVHSFPLLLLALNANDLHLALTATLVPWPPWLVVGMARRLAEDPVFFLIGTEPAPRLAFMPS